MAKKSDNFLADITKPKIKHLSYLDGLRFGLGFGVGILILFSLLGAVAWGVIYFLHIH
ncbi:hypothetical protein HJC99_00995 [Candidatus Saccharibacteria bacterium]|nr:hypothetical protein [Candidatus Saccharibacteria bacterium]